MIVIHETIKNEDVYYKEDLEYLIKVIEEFDKVFVEDEFEETFKKINDVKELLEETLKENY